jgi:rhodanese-related sulfurtransferase
MQTALQQKLLIGPVEYFRAKLEYEATPYGLKQLLDEKPNNVCIVDVRAPKAYAEGHIPGARNVPLESLVASLSSLPKDKTIVTYCGDITCGLSPKAALELAQKGFRVQHLLGGIAEWAKKGFRVEKGVM